MPRKSIWVSSVPIQYGGRMNGAITATISAPAPTDAIGRHREPHAGLPNRPSGRTARTIATSTNVKMIE